VKFRAEHIVDGVRCSDGTWLAVAEYYEEKGWWLTWGSVWVGDEPGYEHYAHRTMRITCPTSFAAGIVEILRPEVKSSSTGFTFRTNSPPFEKRVSVFLPRHTHKRVLAALETVARRHEERMKQAASAA
jgi:hypothetical protein